MERRCSLVRQCTALILAVFMNLNLTNGATGISQGASASVSKPGQLDKLLAPVALYPDALLMQILAASVDSQEVLDGGNWLLQNKSLQGEQLDAASKAAGFGPAMMALFHFPQVVDMMCSEIDWTKQLGEAFTANQVAVLDAVQRLRLLQTTPQQTVVTQQASGQQVIVIQPTNPQVIYVPQYNPVTVYAPPPPAPPQNSGAEGTYFLLIVVWETMPTPFSEGSAFGSNPETRKRQFARPLVLSLLAISKEPTTALHTIARNGLSSSIEKGDCHATRNDWPRQNGCEHGEAPDQGRPSVRGF
jgi:Protein of unknown function (DUF3300)